MLREDITPDSVAYYSCDPKTQHWIDDGQTVYRCFTNYNSAAAPADVALKKAYYAVVAHGYPKFLNVDSTAASEHPEADDYWKYRWGPMQLGDRLQKAVLPYLKDRLGILLCCCFTGQEFASSLAMYIKRYVLAPLGETRIDNPTLAGKPSCKIYIMPYDSTYGPVQHHYFAGDTWPWPVHSIFEWHLFSPTGADVGKIDNGELDKVKAVQMVQQASKG